MCTNVQRDLREIRKNADFSRKSNAMIHRLDAHRDAVGSVNIGLAHGIKKFHAGAINGAPARPSGLTIEA